jgi:hypothetical protein
MSTGLDTGHWAWTNRWAYADQTNDLPHARRVHSRNANAATGNLGASVAAMNSSNTVINNGSVTTRSLPAADNSGSLTQTTSSLSNAGASITSAPQSRAASAGRGPSRIPHVGSMSLSLSLSLSLSQSPALDTL